MKWRPREVRGRVDQVQYGGSVSTVRYGARSCVSVWAGVGVEVWMQHARVGEI